MSTQVGIGKRIHRNPKIAASEAVEMALKTGAIEKADFVFMLESFFTELVRPENRCSSGLDP
jgi:hypothetical protein